MAAALSQGYVCDVENLVGYELVRSYFTLLTNTPEHVWRFFGEDSRYRYADVTGAAVVATGADQIRDMINKQAFEQSTVNIGSADVLRYSDHQWLVEVVGDVCQPYREPYKRSFVQAFLVEYDRTGRFYIRASTLRYGQVIADFQQSVVPPRPSDPDPDPDNDAIECRSADDYRKRPAKQHTESRNPPVAIENVCTNQVFVGRIRDDTTPDHLRETFRRFGHISSVRILNGHNKGGSLTKFNFAFIRFKHSAAVDAILARRSYRLSNGNEVTVNRSKSYIGYFNRK